jgi:hypothetical protein
MRACPDRSMTRLARPCRRDAEHVPLLLVAASPGAHQEATVERGQQPRALGGADRRTCVQEDGVRGLGILASVVQDVLDRASEGGHGHQRPVGRLHLGQPDGRGAGRLSGCRLRCRPRRPSGRLAARRRLAVPGSPGRSAACGGQAEAGQRDGSPQPPAARRYRRLSTGAGGRILHRAGPMPCVHPGARTPRTIPASAMTGWNTTSVNPASRSAASQNSGVAGCSWPTPSP